MARIKRTYGETVSMTTTAQHLATPQGYHEIKHYASSSYRLGLAPSLEKVFVYTASGTTYTDYTDNARDGDSSTHVPLDGMTTSDILYMGFSDLPRGVYFDIGSNAQDEAATLDVEYWDGSAWADVSGDSDGTDSGGDTLKQDGLYSWTLPTDGEEYKVNSVSGLYWIRIKPSTTLSATVDIDEIIPACSDTNYGYFEGGVEYHYPYDTNRVGAIETDMAAGSATLNITWVRT